MPRSTEPPVAANWPRVAVVGAGAVGCYFGGLLARAGAPVTLIGREERVRAIERDGLLLDGVRVQERIPIAATTDLAAVADAELILFCVKTIDTEATARQLAPALARDSLLLSLQNGVDNADRILSITGGRVLPVVVYVAARMEAPNRLKHSGRGDLVLGESTLADTSALAAHFERASIPCRIAADFLAEAWSKLILNCAFNAISALASARYDRIGADEPTRDLMRAVIRESIEVAHVLGIRVDAAAVEEAAWALARNAPDAISSTAQDLARGRRTEIDAFNGYIAEKGASLDVDTPINRALHTLIKLRENAA